MGMAMVQRMSGKSVKVFSDSRLVIGQVKGEFEVKNERVVYNQSLSLSTCCTSLEAVMHMLIL